MAFYLVSAHQPQERRGSPSQAGSRGAYDKKPRALPVSITPAASADRALEQALRQRAIGLLPDIDPRHYFSARLATTAELEAFRQYLVARAGKQPRRDDQELFDRRVDRQTRLYFLKLRRGLSQG